MIPNAFVKKYGEDLPTIFLKAPNGTQWELNLEKRDGKIWFQKGRKEFAECHSLAYGHLLVITYERTFHFHVHIFDKSTLEIGYPGEGKMAFNDQGNKSPNNPNLEHYRSEKTVITTKHVTALDRASSFKPCNPSSLVVMYPSYICKHDHGAMNLPSEFCKIYFDLDKERGDIDLVVLNVRVWPIRYQKRIINVEKRFELTSGWKSFAKDNNLQVGDVCTFKLILRTKLTFQSKTPLFPNSFTLSTPLLLFSAPPLHLSAYIPPSSKGSRRTTISLPLFHRLRLHHPWKNQRVQCEAKDMKEIEGIVLWCYMDDLDELWLWFGRPRQ
ncbi:hypothetical protein VNO77_19642 [Canavalia gladiata]|uniref:TF-B3 domain-containing protein n=1 Tax=Canavalia gladiata TaxID=3824 RepID=A0AAN9QIP1_CANGL